MEFLTIETLPVIQLFLAVMLHFAWQATLVIALVAIARGLIHPRHFQVRYLLSVTGLGAVLFFPLVTLGYYAVNTDAMLALFPRPSGGELTMGTGVEPVGLIGRFEAQFQIVFVWFDDHRFSWLGGWLLGFLVLMLRLSLSLGHCLRLRRRRKPLPPHLQSLARQLKSKLNLTQNVVVGISHEITQAVAIGIIKPVVLIPAAWITQLPLSAIEAVLAHELAHVKRMDLWVNFLQRFTESVFFFHPLIWWLSNTITSEREICCDQLAVRVTGQPLVYVETLAQVAGANANPDITFQFGSAFTGGKNMNLLRRAKLILEPASINAQSPLRTLVLLAGVSVLASYGSYAFCASPTPAITSQQDHDHDHDRTDSHKHHPDGQIIRIRRADQGSDDRAIDVIVVDTDESQDGNLKRELHAHLATLIHENESGAVSQKQLAQQLRELADQLDAENQVARSGNLWGNLWSNIEIAPEREHELHLDAQAFTDRKGNLLLDVTPQGVNRFRVDPRSDESHELIIEYQAQDDDRPHAQDNEQERRLHLRERPVQAKEDDRPQAQVNEHERRFYLRERQERDPQTRQYKKSPDTNEDYKARLYDNFVEVETVQSSDEELGAVLRELRNEVQQLRREVNQLRSDREIPRARAKQKRESTRDYPVWRVEPQRRSNGEAQESEDGAPLKFRFEHKNDQGNTNLENNWIEQIREPHLDSEKVQLKWVAEPPTAETEDEGIVIEEKTTKKRKK